MARRDSIKKELERQEQIEGSSDDLDLMFRVLEVAKTSSDWQALADCGGYRYGKKSYETYRFYYPSQLLLKLRTLFGGMSEEIIND